MSLVPSAISVINLHSTGIGTDSQVHVTQLIWLAAGSVLMFIVAMIDTHHSAVIHFCRHGDHRIGFGAADLQGRKWSRRWLDLDSQVFSRLSLQN